MEGWAASGKHYLPLACSCEVYWVLAEVGGLSKISAMGPLGNCLQYLLQCLFVRNFFWEFRESCCGTQVRASVRALLCHCSAHALSFANRVVARSRVRVPFRRSHHRPLLLLMFSMLGGSFAARSLGLAVDL